MKFKSSSYFFKLNNCIIAIVLFLILTVSNFVINTSYADVNIKAQNLSNKRPQSIPTSPSLKNYNDNIIEQLSTKNLHLALSLGIAYDSNIHKLNTDELNTFENSKEYYNNSKDSFFTTSDINSYFNLNFNKYFLSTLTCDFSDKKMLKNELSYYDERSLGGGSELKYNINDSSKVSLSYYYLYKMQKKTNSSNFTTYSHEHDIVMKSTHTLSSGILSIKIPFDYDLSYDKSKAFSYGTAIFFIPNSDSRIWAPNYSIGYNKIDETDDYIKNSDEFYFSFTNYFTISDLLYTFISIDIYKRLNETKTYAYNYINLSLNGSYYFGFVPNLSINTSISQELTDYDSDTQVHISKVILYLSYNFL